MIDPTYTTKIKERRRTHVKYYLCTDEEVLTEIQEEEQREQQQQREKEQREFVSRVPQTSPTKVLKNKEKTSSPSPTNSLPIDRTQPFNPSIFIREGWSIEEEDEHSLALTEVDLNEIHFETMLKDSESRIVGEEKLTRLKASGNIRLDAKVFQTLWENQHRIPESWKERVNGNIRYIFFEGTVLRSPDGFRFVLCLYWLGGRWEWHYHRLGFDWRAYYLSAVLAQPTL